MAQLRKIPTPTNTVTVAAAMVPYRPISSSKERPPRGSRTTTGAENSSRKVVAGGAAPGAFGGGTAGGGASARRGPPRCSRGLANSPRRIAISRSRRARRSASLASLHSRSAHSLHRYARPGIWRRRSLRSERDGKYHGDQQRAERRQVPDARPIVRHDA